MANARKRARQRRRAKSLIGSMREFLTPEVFKQVRNYLRRRKACKLHFADCSTPGKQKGGYFARRSVEPS